MSDSSSRIVGVPADLLERLAGYAEFIALEFKPDHPHDGRTARAFLASVPSSEGEETAAETAETNKHSRCRNREYVGDGVYYECSRLKGHDAGHDYGWGVGRPPRG